MMKIVLGSESKDKLNVLKKALTELHLDVDVVEEKENADFILEIEEYLKTYDEGEHLITKATLIQQSGEKFVGNGTEIHLYKQKLEEVNKEELFTEAIQNAYVNYLIAKGNLGLRKKSIAFIINQEKEFLIVQLQSYGPDHWNMPGGGIDEGETEEDGIKRELSEELGTDKFEILEKSGIKESYEWPDFVVAKRLKKEGKTYKSQEQTQFIIKFLGNKKDIKLQEEEIRRHKWVKYEDLEEHLIFPNQWDNFKSVIEKSSLKL